MGALKTGPIEGRWNGMTLCSFALLCVLSAPSASQPVFDGSTGGQANGAVAGATIDVDQGTRAGANVFHSFSSFSIPSGQSVTFTDASPSGAISNIINRVTGAGQSQINGSLNSTVSGADVYLINPNGVVFGDGASVNVPKGFHVSTANELRFAGGQAMTMSAGNSTFVAAAPSAFGFTGAAAGEVKFEGANFIGSASSRFSAVAGGVKIQDSASRNSTISVRNGPINIAAVQGAANVPIDPDAAGFVASSKGTIRIGVPDGGAALAGQTRVDAVTTGAVSAATALSLTALTVDIDGAFVSAGSAFTGRSGPIKVVADEDVNVVNGARLASYSAGGTHGAPDLFVTAKNVRVLRGTGATSSFIGLGPLTGFGPVRGGAITIDAAGLVELLGRPSPGVLNGIGALGGEPLSGGPGISVRATDLAIRDGSLIQTGTTTALEAAAISVDVSRDITIFGSGSPLFTTGIASLAVAGDGGELIVSAGRTIFVDGLGVIDSAGFNTSSFGAGNGGNLFLEAPTIQFVRSGGAASSQNELTGVGRGGNVSIDADLFEASGEEGGAQSNSYGLGDAGSVLVTAVNVRLLDGASLSSSAFSTGNAGSVTVEATGDVELLNPIGVSLPSGILTSTGDTSLVDQLYAGGDAGNIRIRAANLRLRGAFIATTSFSTTGDAGAIDIGVSGAVVLDGQNQDPQYTFGSGGASIASGEVGFSTGRTGAITIRSDSLSLQRLASISSRANAPSQAGPSAGIDIQARTIDLNAALISSQTEGLQDAGDIVISGFNQMNVTDGTIDSSSFAEGKAGVIRLTGGGVAIVETAGPQNIFTVNGAGLFAFKGGTGAAGGVIARLTGDLTVDRGTIYSRVGDNSLGKPSGGNGGIVDLSAGRIMMLDGASIETDNNLEGDSGDVVLSASLVEILSGSSVTSTNGNGFDISKTGEAGDITVIGGSLIIDGVGPCPALCAGRLGAGLFSTSRAAGDAGDITIRVDDLQILNEGRIEALAEAGGDGGNIDIRVTNSATIRGQGGFTTPISFVTSGIYTTSAFGSAGNAGAIEFTAGGDLILEGGVIGSSAFGNGDGGDISISAERISASRDAVIASGADGPRASLTKSGDIRIFAEILDFDNSSIAAESDTSGPAGAISITANKILFKNESAIFANTGDGDSRPEFSGPSVVNGAITLRAPDIQFLNSGITTANQVSNRNSRGGNIDIDAGATGTVIFDGYSNNVSAGFDSEGSAGRGGDIVIKGGTIIVSGGAQGSASTIGTAEAADIVLEGNTLKISGAFTHTTPPLFGPAVVQSALKANSGEFGLGLPGNRGPAGAITLKFREINLLDGGQLQAVAFFDAPAGDITVCCSAKMTVSGVGSAVLAGTAANSTGAGGRIFISAAAVDMTQGGRMTVATEGTGRAGAINIRTGAFTATDPGRATDGRPDNQATGLATVTGASGASGAGAGLIQIEAGTFFLTNGAVVTTDSVGAKPAGAINIRASEFVVSGAQTQLISRATGSAGGNAGDITIGAFNWTFKDGATWSTFAQSGGGGNLTIDWNNVGTADKATIKTNVETGGLSAGTIRFGFPVAPLKIEDIAFAEKFASLCGPLDVYGPARPYDPDYVGPKTLIVTQSTIDASNGSIGSGGLIRVGSGVTLLTDGNDLFGDVLSEAGVAGTVTAPAAFVPTAPIIVPERNATTRCEAAQLGSALADNVTGRGAVGEDPGALTPAGLSQDGASHTAAIDCLKTAKGKSARLDTR